MRPAEGDLREVLAIAGFDPDCPDCRAAVRSGRGACDSHYVPTHKRIPPDRCPGCRGPLPGDRDVCGRCVAADVI